jgi:RNA polymerase sigma-70 factor, ECF subfamily
VNVTTDQELCTALATDLDLHFEHVVRTYQDRLYTFALRLTNEAQDAEEIAQDAFIRAYRALSSFTAERVQKLALRAWLYQIALNVFRNRTRLKRLVTVSTDADLGDGVTLEPPDDEAARPEPSAERAEQLTELATKLAALPARHREALVLRYIEGFEYAEIAALLKQPLGTVKSNIHRGLEALRQHYLIQQP